jgi:hypothetical protein
MVRAPSAAPPRPRDQKSTDLHRTVFAGADPEHAVLDLIRLLGLKAIAVRRVPVVVAEVIELAWRALPRLVQQHRLVEFGAHCVRGSGHRLHVREPNRAIRNGLDAFVQHLELLANCDQIGSSCTCLVAVEADPVDRGRITLLVVLVGSREASR